MEHLETDIKFIFNKQTNQYLIRVHEKNILEGIFKSTENDSVNGILIRTSGDEFIKIEMNYIEE